MIELFFDGGCDVNPNGIAAYGFVVKHNGKTVQEGGRIVGKGQGMTNNVAEYSGLIAGLETVISLQETGILPQSEVYIYGDSNLVIKMITQQWGWNFSHTVWHAHKKFPHLQLLLEKALQLLEKVEWRAAWIPRERNSRADYLAEVATADYKRSHKH